MGIHSSYTGRGGWLGGYLNSGVVRFRVGGCDYIEQCLSVSLQASSSRTLDPRKSDDRPRRGALSSFTICHTI